MVCWQIVTSTPPLWYYRELGVVGQPSASVQISSLLSGVTPALNNLLHVPAFFTIAWLWSWALRPRYSMRRAAILALVISVLFGILNELSQLAVPYRSASPADVLSNGLGVALAYAVYTRMAVPSGDRAASTRTATSSS